MRDKYHVIEDDQKKYVISCWCMTKIFTVIPVWTLNQTFICCYPLWIPKQHDKLQINNIWDMPQVSTTWIVLFCQHQSRSQAPAAWLHKNGAPFGKQICCCGHEPKATVHWWHFPTQSKDLAGKQWNYPEWAPPCIPIMRACLADNGHWSQIS